MRLRGRIDANQTEVVNAFRKLGCSVVITSSLGGGVPDLNVGNNGKSAWIEIKDGDKPPSARKLTEYEMDFMQSWKGLYFIVESLDDVVRVVKELEA